MDRTASSPWRRRGTLAGLVAAAVVALGCAVGGDIVGYEMPEEAAKYTYQTETHGVMTVWEYTSAKPTAEDTPQWQPCMDRLLSGVEEKCRPEPLIFLRYDMKLELDNTAKADRTHTITITGYYQERLSTPPAVTSMLVEVSFDNGATWQAVTTTPAGPNTFTAEIRHPKREAVAGTVGLRVNASDAQGNTVKQTMPLAYHLS